MRVCVFSPGGRSSRKYISFPPSSRRKVEKCISQMPHKKRNGFLPFSSPPLARSPSTLSHVQMGEGLRTLRDTFFLTQDSLDCLSLIFRLFGRLRLCHFRQVSPPPSSSSGRQKKTRKSGRGNCITPITHAPGGPACSTHTHGFSLSPSKDARERGKQRGGRFQDDDGAGACG